MSNSNIVNPGLVNVADQAQAPVAITQTIATGPSTNPGVVVQAAGQGSRRVIVEQPIIVTPPTNSGPTTQGGGYAPGHGIPNAASIVTAPMTAVLSVNADLPSPVSSRVISTNQNNVIGQSYGSGSPSNVYV